MKKLIESISPTILKNNYIDINLFHLDDLEIAASGKIKWIVFDRNDKVIRTGFLGSWSSYLIQNLNDDKQVVIRLYNMDYQNFDVYISKFAEV